MAWEDGRVIIYEGKAGTSKPINIVQLFLYIIEHFGLFGQSRTGAAPAPVQRMEDRMKKKG